MSNEINVRDSVSRVINRILSESGRGQRTLEDADTLTGTLEMDSLDLAVLVVGLEQELGVDPFRDGARPVNSFGELVALYEASKK